MMMMTRMVMMSVECCYVHVDVDVEVVVCCCMLFYDDGRCDGDGV